MSTLARRVQMLTLVSGINALTTMPVVTYDMTFSARAHVAAGGLECMVRANTTSVATVDRTAANARCKAVGIAIQANNSSSLVEFGGYTR